ncbi:monovalent cation:proton antiporter-2 (CPA2) family protein [Bdellovibrio sp. HCB2-146]|uniref:monovalent cation:proton antiporter-2 (CPA2) family protein n=1 Tax=Bdellovibrio sp. HCB2-146 TaxID=3394362 RepID=UPI0039BD8CC4
MNTDVNSLDLVKVVALLGSAVILVPLFRRIGLGSVLGYLVTGLIIGPFGLRWFADPRAILHVAEFGVVMFLFIIGLEMRPSYLWSLRRQIFGLGTFQILVCTVALTALGMAFGYPLIVSFIGGMGFVLTSTAIVMQVLSERGDVALVRGQKMVAILLFEDILIVPLLALVSVLTSQAGGGAEGSQWASFFTGVAGLAVLILLGVWTLNPLFQVLSFVKAREVMTAAALLVVLGAALLMQVSGLSMAMGAFLAGVFLAESTFRHQIEADIEPFRGILMGLFFVAVGMSLDLRVVYENTEAIIFGVLAMMLVKALCIYFVARLMKSNHFEALDRASLMAQGGEFAFVLFSAAAAGGLIDAAANANLTAIVVLSMVFTPIVSGLVRRFTHSKVESFADIEEAHGLSGSVLMIGFGRFGQVLSQLLLAKNVDVTIIDLDTEMIRSASGFGFKIYYGDGSRLDVLHASGAGTAKVIAVCIDEKETATRIVELVKVEFPQAKVLVRAYDRTHARELLTAGADFQIRETFESAILFGEEALRQIGVGDLEVSEISERIRLLDLERFELEMAAGATEAGRKLMLGNITKPAPLVEPQRPKEVHL